MTLYSNLASTAKTLLERFGMPVTLRRDTTGAVDPVTGVFTPGVSEDLKPNGVFVTITQQLAAEFGTVEAGDRALVIDATHEPAMSDRIMIDGNPWPIVRIVRVKPADTAIAYKLLVRA